MMHERPPRPEHFEPLGNHSSSAEAIDLQILALLSQRFGLSRDATDMAGAGDEERTAQLSVIRRRAFELGIPVALVTDFWDRMLDAAEAMQAQRGNRALNE
jgi:isochorismate pyruvate lyase